MTTHSIDPQLLTIIIDIVFMLLAIKRGGLFFWLVPVVMSIILFLTVDSVPLKYFSIMMLFAQVVGAYDDFTRERI